MSKVSTSEEMQIQTKLFHEFHFDFDCFAENEREATKMTGVDAPKYFYWHLVAISIDSSIKMNAFPVNTIALHYILIASRVIFYSCTGRIFGFIPRQKKKCIFYR